MSATTRRRPIDTRSPRGSLAARSALTSGIVLTATLAIGAAIAAGSALRTTSASTTVGPSPDASSKATKCPHGKKVLSGGFDSPGFDEITPGKPALFAYASHRLRSRKWTAAAQNDHEDIKKATQELLSLLDKD